MSIHFHPLKVKQIIKETVNTVSIVFDIPENLKETFFYKAGQYLTLRMMIGGERFQRSYSISSWNKDRSLLKVSSKMIDGGKVSTYLFKELKEGQELEVMPPMGNFIMKDEQCKQNAVFFAGGSGITPIMSLIKKSLRSTEQKLFLYYGNQDDTQIIFKEELSQLQNEHPNRLQLKHYLESDCEMMDADKVERIVREFGDEKQNLLYYICGPEGMIQAAKNGLLAAGIAEKQIVIEYFASPKVEDSASKKVEVAASGDVNEISFIIDDEEHQITLDSGEFILEGAERAGVDPPFSCRSGVCTTCKAKVLSGEVEMENNFGLGDEEIKEGYVLTCIGTPKTAGVKVSWDDV